MLHSIVLYRSKSNRGDLGGKCSLCSDFNDFSLFLGIFTLISSDLDPKMVVYTHGTTHGGV